MNNNPRCLYNNTFGKFINEDANAILGELCDRYHGNALTTTIEAWKNEITIMHAGADIVVAGNFVFKAPEPVKAISDLSAL